MNTRTLHNSLLSAVLFVVFLRLISLNSVGLIDTTEGRYAAISQEMVTTGNWITPIIQMGEERVPYLGKPPLYFWCAAVCIELFGSDEWSVRLPSLLAAIIAGYLLILFSRQYLAETDGMLGLLIAFSSLFFFFLSGAAVIDMVLTMSMVGGIVCATIATDTRILSGSRKIFGHLFFLFCGLGFLTKGPIALIFMGFPLTLWSLTRKEFCRWWKLPWWTGLPLFLLITAPWFYLAERESPGFLRYFFLNENLLRFITKDYQDRFGTGHVYPYGSVWIAFIIGFAPWVLLLPYLWFRALTFGKMRTQGLLSFIPRWNDIESSPIMLLILSGLTPVIIFTFGRQFSPLYVLPGIPFLCVAVAWILRKLLADESPHRKELLVIIDSSIYAVTALIGIGAIVTQFLGSPSYVGILSALLGMYIVLKLHQLKNESPTILQRVTLLAVTLAIFFGCTTLGAGPYVSRTRSTRAIIETILAHHKEKKSLIIGVPFGDFGNPFSVWFYDDIAQGRHFELKNINEHTLVDVPSTLIVKTNDLPTLQNVIREKGYMVQATIGRWTWLEARE